jgi:hypothetical protein
MVWAAVELLEMDGYAARVGGLDPEEAIAHRRLVEAALTLDELRFVDVELAGDYRGGRVEHFWREVGPPPTDDEVIEAKTQILGRQPRYGR